MTPEQLQALRDRATRPRRTVPIVLDGTLRERIEDATAELAAARVADEKDKRLAAKPRAAEVEAELNRLYDEAAASTLLVVVEGLTGTAWRALCAQFPPKLDEHGNRLVPGIYDAFLDREAAEEALIRAAVIGQVPSLDSTEVEPLPDDMLDWLLVDDGGFLTVDQRDTLFVAAWQVSRGPDAVPLRRARSETATSEGA